MIKPTRETIFLFPVSLLLVLWLYVEQNLLNPSLNSPNAIFYLIYGFVCFLGLWAITVIAKVALQKYNQGVLTILAYSIAALAVVFISYGFGGPIIAFPVIIGLFIAAIRHFY